MVSSGFPFPSGGVAANVVALSDGAQADAAFELTTIKWFGTAALDGTGAPQQCDSVSLAAGTWAVIGMAGDVGTGISALVISAAPNSAVPIGIQQTNGSNGTVTPRVVAATVVVAVTTTVYLNATSGVGDAPQGLIVAARVV